MGISITTVDAPASGPDLVLAHVRDRHQFGVPIGVVSGRAAQGGGHARCDRAGPRWPPLLGADDQRRRPAPAAGRGDGESRCGRMPVGGIPARPAALWRHGLHLGERCPVRAQAGQVGELMLGGAAEHRAVIANEYRGCDAADLRSRRPEEFRRNSSSSSRPTCPPRPRPPNDRGRCRTCPPGRGAGSGCCSTTAGCCRGSPEFGSRNATVLQQFVHLEELCNRRIYHSFNPQASTSLRRRSSRSVPRGRSTAGRCRCSRAR